MEIPICKNGGALTMDKKVNKVKIFNTPKASLNGTKSLSPDHLCNTDSLSSTAMSENLLTKGNLPSKQELRHKSRVPSREDKSQSMTFTTTNPAVGALL